MLLEVFMLLKTSYGTSCSSDTENVGTIDLQTVIQTGPFGENEGLSVEGKDPTVIT